MRRGGDAGAGRHGGAGARHRGPAALAAALAAAFAVGTPAAPASAQTAPADAATAEFLEWRFPVGERAVYDVTFGPVKVGRGELEVEAIDTLAAGPAYRLAFDLEGGPFFYKIDDRTVSWVATDPLRTLQFEQRLREGDYRRDRRYVFDQEGGTYSRQDWHEETGRFITVPDKRDLPMPTAALDEIAYLYLARTVPLEPGRSYRFNRYFEEDGNPVILEVLRRETVRVPAGRFETVVVRPIIRTDGMFGEGGRAEVYLTDDDRRLIVLLRSKMKVGELNMYLKEHAPGSPDGYLAASPGAGQGGGSR